MLDADRLLVLADLNLAEAQREHARFLPPFEIVERDGLLFTAGGTRFPASPFNGATTAVAEPADAERLLGEARRFFAARNRGFGVQARAHRDAALISHCEEHGIPLGGNSPGMVLDAPIPAPPLPSGAELRTVETGSDATRFAEVEAAAFDALGLPEAVGRKILSQPRAWLLPHWHVCMALEEGRPVAGAMVLLSHGIAGIYWVGTLADARGRGFGAAVTTAVANAAFERGAEAVVLQASKFGEPVYRRLGFREFTRYPWFMVLEPSSS